MPNGGFIKTERTFGDTYTQNKKTGRLTGRKSVKGAGDRTGINRVQKDFVLVKKSKTARGHTRTIRKEFSKGQIVGKSKRLKK